VIPRGSLRNLSAVALNPQPLSPQELGAAMASEFIQIINLEKKGDRYEICSIKSI
jgi:hypothetical protein